MKQKTDIFAFCTRKGYCKDGYCNYRAGDLSPRVDKRVEVFELTSVKAPGPCLDRCCPVDCAQNSTLAAVWESSRTYRTDEMKLPPRLLRCLMYWGSNTCANGYCLPVVVIHDSVWIKRTTVCHTLSVVNQVYFVYSMMESMLLLCGYCRANWSIVIGFLSAGTQVLQKLYMSTYNNLSITQSNRDFINSLNTSPWPGTHFGLTLGTKQLAFFLISKIFFVDALRIIHPFHGLDKDTNTCYMKMS